MTVYRLSIQNKASQIGYSEQTYCSLVGGYTIFLLRGAGMHKKRLLLITACGITVALLHACSISAVQEKLLKPSTAQLPTPHTQTFAKYVKEYTDYIRTARIPLNAQQATQEVLFNAPFELSQKKDCADGKKRGILLGHGLNDSAYQMRALAQVFAANCFLVRVLTLDGHGTRPGDILKVGKENWFKQFAFGIQSFANEVDLLYLGGFSTSANIATYFALRDDAIAGLALFSPAFMPNIYYPKTLAALSLFRTWLVTGEPADYVKYPSFSTHSFLLYYNTVEQLQEAFAGNATFKKPVFIAISSADSVVDVTYVRNVFDKRFTHPASTMHLYTKLPVGARAQRISEKVHAFQSFLPQQQIIEISHLSLANDATEPHYGKNGDYVFCSTSIYERSRERCQSAQKSEIWFGDWEVHERANMPEDTIFARLTYNPYFKEMAQTAVRTLLAD